VLTSQGKRRAMRPVSDLRLIIQRLLIEGVQIVLGAETPIGKYPANGL
jgi:hypothetical protein